MPSRVLTWVATVKHDSEGDQRRNRSATVFASVTVSFGEGGWATVPTSLRGIRVNSIASVEIILRAVAEQMEVGIQGKTQSPIPLIGPRRLSLR